MAIDELTFSESFHTASNDLPWADRWGGLDGVRLKLLMADIDAGRYVVRMQFAPGVLVAPHKHSGEIHAFTFSGEWSYLEYPDGPSNRQGSYLFEPAGSTHTLKVSDANDDETDILFVMSGAMLHLDETGAVVAVTDAQSVIRDYAALLRAQNEVLPMLPIGRGIKYTQLV